ncbi:MAG: hypothetical protein CMJ18_18190 [Phycisphaeraceae bacterium]|nr:hypothetical protein [Phycisphaeraceae bacterium]
MFAGSARADWIPGDGHKMHWPQLPDPNGWDVNATTVDPIFPRTLADDWRCSESGPVEDIHFWGSFRDDVFNQPMMLFRIGIWSDVPTNPDMDPPWSHPGDLLWEFETDDVGIVPVDPPSMQGWLDPFTGEAIEQNHQNYFQYNVVDIPRPFIQERGKIYWLSIEAQNVAAPANVQWGWKTSRSQHFLDDATFQESGPGIVPFWHELIDPITGESLDLAFVITPEPGSLIMLLVGLALMRGWWSKRS